MLVDKLLERLVNVPPFAVVVIAQVCHTDNTVLFEFFQEVFSCRHRDVHKQRMYTSKGCVIRLLLCTSYFHHPVDLFLDLFVGQLAQIQFEEPDMPGRVIEHVIEFPFVELMFHVDESLDHLPDVFELFRVGFGIEFHIHFAVPIEKSRENVGSPEICSEDNDWPVDYPMRCLHQEVITRERVFSSVLNSVSGY